MIAVIDNYDSFTFNLVQYLGDLGASVRVFRNDQVSEEDLTTGGYTGLVISPGPGTPADAGISGRAILALAGKIPILGVCLGHQCIGQVYGAKVVNSPKLMHGKTSAIFHQGSSLFSGLSSPFTATRYHSLTVERTSLPPHLVVTAQTEDGEIMGLRHTGLDVEGVQFHPESILTTGGKQILRNFLLRIRAA